MDFETAMKQRPHVVILGAGASCAAIPNGDKHNKKISAMSGFIEKLGLGHILNKVSIHTQSDNLEDIYMELDARSATEPDCHEVKSKLEEIIHKYMSEYELPDEPTIYDFLILSLTKKDLIATFNWDPLLVQALRRAQLHTENLPNIVFLHGNVAVGYCETDNVIGYVGSKCKCNKPLEPTKLLYPVKQKDYNSDVSIRKSWQILSNALEKAYMVTIFGYSAPASDVAAMEMMEKAWGSMDARNLEEIEIIDIRDENDVLNSWNNFIHTHHYSYVDNFFDTTLGKFPRRTCEATFDRTMNCQWLTSSKGFKKNMSFEDIDFAIQELLNDEISKKDTRKMLNNLYK